MGKQQKPIGEWKPVCGFNGDYEVSSDGIVWSNISHKIRKPYRINSGYLGITLYQNGVEKKKTVHSIVAEAFLEKQEGKNEVNHKNFNKFDNRVSNLEWVSHKENCKHAEKKRRQCFKDRVCKNRAGERNIDITPYGKYRPHITLSGKNIYFGLFDTLDEAIAARDRKEELLIK